jgi:hypothetical protein
MWSQLLLTSLLAVVVPEAFVHGFPGRQRDYGHQVSSSHNHRRAANGTYNLWVSHYSGKVYTLSFDAATSELSIIQELESCGGLPSWLAWDGELGVYCIDETFETADGAPANGSMTYYFANEKTSLLTEQASVKTLPGGVAGLVYSSLDSQQMLIAIAH